MDGTLEIYSNLIIAIITFIAPLTVYSLSTFNEGPDLLEKNEKEMEEQTIKLVGSEVSGKKYHPEVVEKSNQGLMKIRIRNQKMIKRLTPEHQMFRLFSPLIISLLLVMLYKLTEDGTICLSNNSYANLILLGSVASFVTALVFLKQVAWAIVHTQRLVYKNKNSESINALGK